jgi:hypothetical protein
MRGLICVVARVEGVVQRGEAKLCNGKVARHYQQQQHRRK